MTPKQSDRPKPTIIRQPRSKSLWPILSEAPTVDRLTCPACHLKTGRWRSGKECKGQILCNNCGTVWTLG